MIARSIENQISTQKFNTKIQQKNRNFRNFDEAAFRGGHLHIHRSADNFRNFDGSTFSRGTPWNQLRFWRQQCVFFLLFSVHPIIREDKQKGNTQLPLMASVLGANSTWDSLIWKSALSEHVSGLDLGANRAWDPSLWRSILHTFIHQLGDSIGKPTVIGIPWFGKPFGTSCFAFLGVGFGGQLCWGSLDLEMLFKHLSQHAWGIDLRAHCARDPLM